MTLSSLSRFIAVDPAIRFSALQVGKLNSRFQVIRGWPEKTPVEGLLIHSKVTEKFLREIEGLKWVAVRAKNTDYAPSIPGIQKFGIPSLGAYAVTEHTFALILGLKKQLFKSDHQVKTGLWREGMELNGDLRGSTLGIVGCGTIGSQVAAIAHLFGMKVIVAASPKSSKPTDLPLSEVLGQSDILTIHVPGGGNDNLIGDKELSLMKPTAILINTSRGNVIDEEALKWALDEERLAGAGLDVFKEEPPKALSSPLAFHPKVLATPHMGFQTKLTLEEMSDALVQTVLDTIK
jgi:phosphoglycerate dehydrogenase-like enzyme